MAVRESEEVIFASYQKLLPELKSFLYRLTSDREVTNDLTQDTFIRVIEKQTQFKELSSFKTWVFSIASNLAIDWLRKGKRWKETAQDEARRLSQLNPLYRESFLEVHKNSPSGRFDFVEHINFCFTCISKTLTIEQQVTLILKDIYDFKISEIAEILTTPQGTIKHWLFTARKTMTDIFHRRCALVNKDGPCHQCSELNGLFNPSQKLQEDILRKSTSSPKENFYLLRAKLIKAIDPLNSDGADLEEAIMQVLRKTIEDN